MLNNKTLPQNTFSKDEAYMLRCLEIAKNGLGTTAPNPMVGAVIVHEDKIIGEGFTSPYGGPHAEVNAINSVADKELLKHATIYVTLEPCSHHGKTPPCADLIAKHGIPRVVIGLIDPHTKVAGKGIEKLKNAGSNVITGCLEKECREHHRRFLTFQEKKRPYIILKWAQTADGFIAPKKEERATNPEPYWITGPYSRQLVHKWRSEEQSILVGTNTVLEDNPKLDVRLYTGKNPIRIVLDRKLKISADYNILDGSIPTLVLTDMVDTPLLKENAAYRQIDFKGDIAQQICEVLYKENITSVLIEGGTQTLQTFINSGLWDEARIFTGDSQFKTGILAPELKGKIISTKSIDKDTLKIYGND
ncbi:bifunctional diaminohydroxyphosphoribosylaminopyrimidine deaminase/5-amino-6-(5-phosphoribosylamino)uracil reductase RibD [Zobellia nedashkovskayae]|uniref:bifunctional diaminohydroxyphosphoribosylaminopyrimidine deaminase/5-amino-6-(5-phosphoribosylamino)uracil reductase RibD n=1 Tax=Zobellia nedashkovskayae TaxID=2779510 RepID=UPI001D038A82|nr:bifunctional diaminohydroxyphosphoribosylaminopyrimidine deaminase/5-amino-6-(5-phosphoribosylamino)uracil reductase RibD [Zobellia nedashkovskayae]